ncbi:unnamed protein product [Adineta steineri]|uniref:Uncharacterized protein n=1 Tax=Adineta steineri TaxID=433720 RepID=A0A814QCZ5_9BILA|nr:unnamed protein product [Adineta steineri]CAF1420609.1 unnamed protein product [Adineta steineri]CAF1426171.1 unnamed protein product [Adineta steineri]
MQLLETKVLNAIHQARYEQLELYIRHKYNLNVSTEDGRNGLFFALDISDARQRRRMIKFCLDHGINPLQKEHINGYTPLQEAIARQQVDSVQLLLANISGEIDWHAFDARGRTILHQAVESNNIAILESLINLMNHYGVLVDIPDKNGLTPYLLATKLHLRDMAQILVNKGHASQRQCDLTTHRTANDWEIVGIEAHSSLVRDKLQQEINNAMNEGKINKVKQLKHIYDTQLLSPPNQLIRSNSFIPILPMSSSNDKSRMSINEMIDRFPGGVVPDTYITSIKEPQNFRSKHGLQTSQSFSTALPSISTTRRYRPPLTVNALLDLFQVAAEQFAPSYRSPMRNNPEKSFDQYARRNDSKNPHRSTLATLKTDTNASSTANRRLSNNAITNKRVA